MLPRFVGKRPTVARLVALAIGAVALSFAFSPFPLRFLSPIALIPLFWVIDTERPKRTFLYALFFGSVFFLCHLWWLYTLVVPVARVTRVLLDIGVTLLFGYMGLWIALFAWGTRRLGLYAAPFIWAGTEWLRSQTEGGFPWGLLGTSLTPYAPLIQGASVVGVYGVSALVVWWGLLLYRLLKGPGRDLFAGLLAVSVLLPFGFGLVRMKPNRFWFRAGLIQPNVSPVEKGKTKTREQNWRDLLRLSRQAIGQGARVLVFPETATLTDISDSGPFQDSLHRLSDTCGVLIVTGTPLYRSFGYMNATTVFVPHQPLTDFYWKIHPAPFSEHFPFVDKVPLLRKVMTNDMGNQVSGSELKVFDISGHKFSTAICFEGIFPGLIRQFCRRGAEMIAIVTNDGWFGKTPGPYQHCELMVMRAVENGVPLVRAANNGISLVSDPYGRILSQTGLFVEATLIQDVPRPAGATFYRRFGDVFSILCLLTIGVLILVRVALRKKPPMDTDERREFRSSRVQEFRSSTPQLSNSQTPQLF
jgi:apolipoprotein N-acyltransferase